MRAPPALRPGARIAVIAPASPFDPAGFRAGVARLSTRYRVTHAPDVFSREGYLAGDDARRLQELREALADPEVKAIVAARGGYGTTRLLEHLDVAEVARHPKLLVGFSDVTALHALWARAGLRSLHATMAARLGSVSAAAWRRWVASVEGGLPPALSGLQALAGGRAHGRLVGGNLALLAALCGTPYAPPLDGGILFLEDVSERPYRIDRMLTTLRQAGWLRRVGAVLIGQFTHCAPGPDGRKVQDVMQDRLADLGIPVLSGLAVGHGKPNRELPLGALARVDADAGNVVFEEPAAATADPACGPGPQKS